MDKNWQYSFFEPLSHDSDNDAVDDHMDNTLNTRARSESEHAHNSTTYMVSPHHYTENFYDNIFAMNLDHIDEHGTLAVQPKFINSEQAMDFRSAAIQASSMYMSDQSSVEYKTMMALMDASNQHDAASLRNIEKDATVIVQGHGSPGVDSIHPTTGLNSEGISAREMAATLHKMELPDINEVRVNSCYSGTDQELVMNNNNKMMERFKKGTMGQHDGGNWSNTYAGKLEQELVGQGHRNPVRGYLGPTSIDEVGVYTRQGAQTYDFAVTFKRQSSQSNDIEYYPVPKEDASRMNPEAHKLFNQTRIPFANITAANKFRNRILKAKGGGALQDDPRNTDNADAIPKALQPPQPAPMPNAPNKAPKDYLLGKSGMIYKKK